MIYLGDIDMTLDPKSINRAIRKINKLNSQIQKMMDALCQYLLEEGVSKARLQLVKFLPRADGGDLYNSIKHLAYDRKNGIGYLVAGDGLFVGKENISYAVLVEKGFPEGMAQKKEQAPKTTGIWSPNLKLPAKKVEPVPETKDTGWTYFDERDGHYYVSHGQPPRPFMYNTLVDLQMVVKSKSYKFVAEYLMEEE